MPSGTIFEKGLGAKIVLLFIDFIKIFILIKTIFYHEKHYVVINHFLNQISFIFEKIILLDIKHLFS